MSKLASENVTRRRRRRLLVPLVGLGVAAWLVRRRLDAGQRLDEGWPDLPPASWPLPADVERAVAAPDISQEPQAAPVADTPAPPRPVLPTPASSKPSPSKPSPSKPAASKAAAPRLKPAPPAAMPPTAPVAPAVAALLELPLEQPAARSATAVPAATAVASVTAPALPEAPFGPGSVRALSDGTSPDPDCTIKGKTATKVFHAPGGAYYTRTRADVWFRSPADARAAGFTERGPRRHR